MLKKMMLLMLALNIPIFNTKISGMIVENSENKDQIDQKLSELLDLNEDGDDPGRNRSIFNGEFFKILGASVLGSIFYGIVQDQITARLCIEYFNSEAVPHHKKFLDAWGVTTDSPTLIASIFGIAATWWAGLIGGTILGLSSQVGSKLAPLAFKDCRNEMAIVFTAVGIIAFFAGIVGYCDHTAIDRLGLADRVIFIPQQKRAAFVAVNFAHNAAYFAAAIGVILISMRVMYKRGVVTYKKYQEFKKKLIACKTLIKNRFK